MADLIDVPHGMTVKESLFLKRLQSGFYAEVFLVMNNSQYEAALFLNDKFKPGPPIPHPLDIPTSQYSHFMGVRPSVGFTPEEAERIISEVEGENAYHRRRMKDNWGKLDDD